MLINKHLLQFFLFHGEDFQLLFRQIIKGCPLLCSDLQQSNAKIEIHPDKVEEEKNNERYGKEAFQF